MKPALPVLLLALLPAAYAAPSACPREVWSPQIALARMSLLKNDASALRGFFTWVAGRADLPGLSARTRALATDPRLLPGQGEPDDAVELAAGALTDIGLACASCHQGAGVSPRATTSTPPPASDGVSAHMARHLWAMDRLWEGVVGPSEARWAEGVAALHDHPLDAERLQGREGGQSPSDYMEWWIHQPGQSEARHADAAGRARLYGQMLTACAACHAGTAGAPSTP